MGRNYHVFYYMLAGADDKEREALHLSRPEDYRYLSQVSSTLHTFLVHHLHSFVYRGRSNSHHRERERERVCVRERERESV